MGPPSYSRSVQTAWGSRDGADDDDAFRMIRVSQKQLEAASARSPDLLANDTNPSSFTSPWST